MVQMLQIQGLMGGRLKIVRFNARKNFDARVYNTNPLNSVIRSLKFTVLQVETDFAIEVWAELIPQIDAEISTKAGSIEAAVNSYLDSEQKRVIRTCVIARAQSQVAIREERRRCMDFKQMT